MVLLISSSFKCLGRAAICDCGTLWTFLLPFLSVSSSSCWLGRAAACDCGTPLTFLLHCFHSDCNVILVIHFLTDTLTSILVISYCRVFIVVSSLYSFDFYVLGDVALIS